MLLVAHISDLHLLALDRVRPRDFLNKRVTGGLNLLFNRGGKFPVEVARRLVADLGHQKPDHVIVTGDLTNLAFPAEFELARRVLAELELPPSAVTVVPGNHDCYTRRSAVEDHFGRVMGDFLGADIQPGPGRFPFVRLCGELAVVALNSARPAPPLMAVGSLGARQLHLAEKLLTSTECRGRFRLVALHHPPWAEAIRWHNRLTDANALIDVLQRTGAELVAHGHLHRYCRGVLPGREQQVPVIGVGSGTWTSPEDPSRRAQYNLYRIDNRRLVEVSRRRYDPASRVFEPCD